MRTIETGYGYRSSADYFFLSPDWRTLYVSRIKRNFGTVEQNGKRLIHREFESDVRAWDLAAAICVYRLAQEQKLGRALSFWQSS